MLLFLSKQKGRWPGSFRDGNNGRTSVVLAQGLQPGIGLWGGVSRLGRNSHISPLHWPIPPVKILKRSPAAARCHIACFTVFVPALVLAVSGLSYGLPPEPPPPAPCCPELDFRTNAHYGNTFGDGGSRAYARA